MQRTVAQSDLHGQDKPWTKSPSCPVPYVSRGGTGTAVRGQDSKNTQFLTVLDNDFLLTTLLTGGPWGPSIPAASLTPSAGPAPSGPQPVCRKGDLSRTERAWSPSNEHWPLVKPRLGAAPGPSAWHSFSPHDKPVKPGHCDHSRRFGGGDMAVQRGQTTCPSSASSRDTKTGPKPRAAGL